MLEVCKIYLSSILIHSQTIVSVLYLAQVKPYDSMKPNYSGQGTRPSLFNLGLASISILEPIPLAKGMKAHVH